MKPPTFLLLAAMLAAIPTAVLPPASALALDRTCLSDRQIYSGVEQGQIASLEDVLQANGIDRSSEILSVEVCNDGSGYAYYVSVLNSYGEAKTLVLPASQ